MYRHQFGEFVCGYWGLKGNWMRGPTWVQISNSLYAVAVTLPRISNSNERKEK